MDEMIDKDKCNESGYYAPVDENNEVNWKDQRFFNLGEYFPNDGREWIPISALEKRR